MRIEGEEEGVKRGGGKVEERMAKGWMGREGEQKGKEQGPEKRKGRREKAGRTEGKGARESRGEGSMRKIGRGGSDKEEQ